MIIYGGIDEAGFGPLIGPLVISLTLFKLDNVPTNAPPPMWEILKESITRSRKDPQKRIPIDDSKKLKSTGTKFPIKHLERGVLSFFLQNHDMPLNDSELFQNLGSTLPKKCPWYKEKINIPSENPIDRINLDKTRLRNTLSSNSVEIIAHKIKIIDAQELNILSQQAGTKSRVNLDAILLLVEKTRQSIPGLCPKIIIDRQGGRIHYAEQLRRFWPESRLEIIGENISIARYRISDNQGSFLLSFETKSEINHFPVALASMSAKYIRELSMKRINNYFTKQMPFLSPTAGYVQDGRRFLKEIKPLLDKISGGQGLLIRKS